MIGCMYVPTDHATFCVVALAILVSRIPGQGGWTGMLASALLCVAGSLVASLLVHPTCLGAPDGKCIRSAT